MIKVTLLVVFLLTSCVKSPIVEKDPKPILPEPEVVEEIVFYDPVETEPTNTEFKPYFEGQTRAKGIKTVESYSVDLIREGLDSPWGIDSLPSGQFIITEKSGTIRILNQDGNVSDKIFVTDEIDDSGQGGLLDVLVSPDFEIDKTVYFTLAEKANQGSVTAVAKAQLDLENTTISQFTIIYRALPYFSGNNHYGSRIVMDDKGNLYVSTGDRQSLSTRGNAQKLDNGHGKILYIDTDGNAVNTNPFYHNDSAHQAIYSIGHRNIQGLAIHPLTHELWANEMGPQGGDELNLIESGQNYGWPIISYGEEYSGLPIGEGISVKDGLEHPLYYWDPVIAPAGMIFYESDVIKEWQNNLFISSLKAQHITRLLIRDNRVIGEERIAENLGQRFRDITEGNDGALYTITDSGQVYRIGK